MALARALTLLLLAQASYPYTQADLERALSDARAAWGADTAVTIRSGVLNSCELAIGKHPTMAITETVTLVTRFIDEDGIETESKSDAHVITINSACDWSRLPLGKAVIHEYGHALGLSHSEDKHSIMYWIVWTDGKQAIMPADRENVRSQQHSAD